MQNLVDASHAVSMHVAGPKILWTMGPTPPNLKAWMTHRNDRITLLPHMFYHTYVTYVIWQ